MNDTPKEQLRETALRVQAELESYFAVHNEIFTKQASFRSSVRHFFGGRIPFEENYSRAVATKERLASLDVYIHSFVAQTWHSFSKEEQMFGVALREYAKVLAATARALEVRQKWLFRKSEGTIVPSKAFRILEDEYAKGITEYRRLGAEVNRLSYVIK